MFAPLRFRQFDCPWRLEERRTQAVQLRRGLPLEARDLSALDPAAIQRVRAEAAAAPRNAEELHDLLHEFVVQRPVSAWQPWFDELQRSSRAALLFSAQGEFWFCAERHTDVAALFPDAMMGSVAPIASTNREPAASPEQLASEVVRATLDALGPTTPQALTRLLVFCQARLKGGIGLLARACSLRLLLLTLLLPLLLHVRGLDRPIAITASVVLRGLRRDERPYRLELKPRITEKYLRGL
jgi:hypothetical protein